jgi:protein-S-isoprenylcysteine O-methyltransferase Ste14
LGDERRVAGNPRAHDGERAALIAMSYRKMIAGILIHVALFGGPLFLPAGTLDWWRAWVFLGADLVCAVASTVSIYRVNKELLDERFKSPVQKGQPLTDKILVLLIIAGFLGMLVLIPLDVFRFHLLPKPPILVSSLGLALFFVGWWIMTLALRENAFAAPVVRHQEERQHRVIESGVYGIVRHPMYAGAAPFFIGTPLWLESYAAAIFACFPLAVLVLRIQLEEGFLRRELAGYEAYMQRVRYRLIPFVW